MCVCPSSKHPGYQPHGLTPAFGKRLLLCLPQRIKWNGIWILSEAFSEARELAMTRKAEQGAKGWQGGRSSSSEMLRRLLPALKYRR